MWGSGCCCALRNKARVPLTVGGAEPCPYPAGCAFGICFTPSASQAGPLTFWLAFISAFLSDSLPAQWLCRQLSLPRGSQRSGMKAVMGSRGRADHSREDALFGFLDLVPFSKHFERVCSELVLGPATGETERAHRSGPGGAFVQWRGFPGRKKMHSSMSSA